MAASPRVKRRYSLVIMRSWFGSWLTRRQEQTSIEHLKELLGIVETLYFLSKYSTTGHATRIYAFDVIRG